MTSNQYRKALKTVGLSIVGAGRFFDVDRRTAQRWAKEGPSPSAVTCLKLMLALGLDAEKAKSIIDQGGPRLPD